MITRGLFSHPYYYFTSISPFSVCIATSTHERGPFPISFFKSFVSFHFPSPAPHFLCISVLPLLKKICFPFPPEDHLYLDTPFTLLPTSYVFTPPLSFRSPFFSHPPQIIFILTLPLSFPSFCAGV